MVRRRFLALTGRTLAAIGLAGLGTRPAKAEIGTILAIINTAASLTGLFFGGDNGAAPLQVAMLRAISAQLLEIGTGIVEILKDLTELKRLVGDIPEQTVIAMYRDDVYGLINGVYQARLEEYERGGYASHPDTLRDWAARMSRTVLEPLERDRNVLMNPKFEARSLVPIVCQACFVETQGINLVAYAPERKLAVVHAYQRWLTEVSDGSTGESITGKIRELEVAQKKNLASIKAFTPEVFECYTDVMGAAGLYRGWKFRMTTNYKIYDIYWADGQPQEALSKINSRIFQLEHDGILPREDTPRNFEFQYTHPPAQDAVAVPPIANCLDEIHRREAPTQQLSQALTNQGLQLISLYSLRHTARQALTYLDTLSTRYEAQLRQ